jgi:hypothetical protein
VLRAERLVALDQSDRRAVDRGERRSQLVRDRGDEVAAHPLEGPLLGEIAERVDRPFGEPHAGNREPELAAADVERDALGAASGRSGLGGDRDPLGQLGPTRDDALRIAAQHLLGAQARDRLGRRIPEPDDAVAVDHEDAVADMSEDEGRARPLLRLTVQAGVVRQRAGRRAILLCEREIGSAL